MPLRYPKGHSYPAQLNLPQSRLIGVYAVVNFIIALVILAEHFSAYESSLSSYLPPVRLGLSALLLASVGAYLLSNRVRKRFVQVNYLLFSLVAAEALLEFWILPDKGYAGIFVALTTLLSGIYFLHKRAFMAFAVVWAVALALTSVFLLAPFSPGLVWVIVSFVALLAYGIMTYIRDLLQARIQLMTSFTEAGYNPVIGLSVTGELLYYNPAAEVEFPGIGAPNASHPLVRSLFRLLDLDQADSSEKIKRLQFQEKTLEIRYSQAARLKTYRIFITDITEQHRREEALSNRRDMYRSLVEESVEGLLILEKAGAIKFANQHFFNLFGVKPFTGPLTTQNPSFGEAELNRFIQKVQRRFTGVPEVYELLLPQETGPDRVVLVSLRPYVNSQGLPEGIVVSMTDMSRLKETEAVIRERMAQMEKFLNHTTHDLQGPVSTIRGLVGLAFAEGVSEKVAKQLTQIGQMTEEMSAALIDLLDVTRLQTATPQLMEVDLRSLVDHICNRLRYLSDYDRVLIQNETPANIILQTDRRYLEAIMANLISNGIKYHRKQATDPFVRIGAHVVGQEIHITVKDNGEGIPYSLQPVIFEMYFRGNRRSSGTGLGLYISRLSVEKLDGKLSFESVPGMGATFTVTLPVHSLSKTAKPQQSRAADRLT